MEGSRTPPSSQRDRRAERVAGRATEVQAARGVRFGVKTKGGGETLAQGGRMEDDRELLAATGGGAWRGGEAWGGALSRALDVSPSRKGKARPAGLSKG